MPPGCVVQAPDGRHICFEFNTPGRFCNFGPACRFAHVCGRCFKKDVPMFSCNHQAVQPPASPAGAAPWVAQRR